MQAFTDFLNNAVSFSDAQNGVFNFATLAGILEPFGKVAGAIAKLLGLVK